jgi:hypothetical protein
MFPGKPTKMGGTGLLSYRYMGMGKRWLRNGIEWGKMDTIKDGGCNFLEDIILPVYREGVCVHRQG